jgi:hypothetical protein
LKIAGEGVEDLVGGLGPHVGPLVVVSRVDPGADVGVELAPGGSPSIFFKNARKSSALLVSPHPIGWMISIAAQNRMPGGGGSEVVDDAQRCR